VAFLLNLSFTLIELVGGLWTNSIAILSDALHDLGDTLSIGLALFLERRAQAPADERFHFGYRRLSVLSAFLTAGVLLVGSIGILWVAIPRLWQPEAVHAPGMAALAVLGIVVNGVAVLRLKRGHKHSLNQQAVRLHLLEDALGWVIVLLGSLAMWVWGLPWLDPLLSIGLALYILRNAARTAYKSLLLMMQAAPTQVDTTLLRQQLASLPNVLSVSKLQLWSFDGEHHAAILSLETQAPLSAENHRQLYQSAEAVLQKADIIMPHISIIPKEPHQT
jgi:cobalt-zinc-cadmium efflux system protein